MEEIKNIYIHSIPIYNTQGASVWHNTIFNITTWDKPVIMQLVCWLYCLTSTELKVNTKGICIPKLKYKCKLNHIDCNSVDNSFFITHATITADHTPDDALSICTMAPGECTD